MRIAMIGHKSIFSTKGGIEKTVRHLSFYLTAKGHEVTVYDRSNYYRNSLRDSELSDELVNQIKTNEKLHVVKIPTVSGAGEVPVYSFLAALCAALSRNDVVIFHASGPCLMIPIAKLFGKKTIAYIHALDSQRSKWNRFASWYLSKGERTAAKKADSYLVLSEAIRDYLKEKYGREANLTLNGIEAPVDFEEETEEKTLSEIGLTKDEYLFWSGRFCPEKGLQYLIPAFLSCNTDKKLVLAGETDNDKDSFYHKIRAMCDNNINILFIGNRRAKELQILYHNAFAFVFPSELEGMAHSLLEALANEATCILSDIPENQSVAGEHALYFHSQNALELEERLKYLFAHPEIREELTKGQKEEILSDYSIEKGGAQMASICEELLRS